MSDNVETDLDRKVTWQVAPPADARPAAEPDSEDHAVSIRFAIANTYEGRQRERCLQFFAAAEHRTWELEQALKTAGEVIVREQQWRAQADARLSRLLAGLEELEQTWRYGSKYYADGNAAAELCADELKALLALARQEPPT